MYYTDPVALGIWGVVILASLVLTVVGMCRSWRSLRCYRREALGRIRSLPIHRMLGRLGVGASEYLRRAKPADLERHLYRCERCPEPGACDDYLEHRAPRDPRQFCPNYGELTHLAHHQPAVGRVEPPRQQAHSPSP
jgi:hypothetical protein